MPEGKPKRITLTKEVKKFIVDKLSEGYSLAEQKRLWPDQVVTPSAAYKRSQIDESWASQLDQGYTLWFYAKLEELEYLSKSLASDVYPDIQFREAEAALKRRVDALKFQLGKMAPILSKKFDKAQKLEVDNKNGVTINVLEYHRQPLVKDIDEYRAEAIEHKQDR